MGAKMDPTGWSTIVSHAKDRIPREGPGKQWDAARRTVINISYKLVRMKHTANFATNVTSPVVVWQCST